MSLTTETGISDWEWGPWQSKGINGKFRRRFDGKTDTVNSLLLAYELSIQQSLTTSTGPILLIHNSIPYYLWLDCLKNLPSQWMSEAVGDIQPYIYSGFVLLCPSQHCHTALEKFAVSHLWHGTSWDTADNLITKDGETKKYVQRFLSHYSE